MPPPRKRRYTAVALLVGVMGVVVALALPFLPVISTQTTVTWPAPGRPVVSSTALFAPYRPVELTAAVPCSVIRAAGRGGVVTVLATGPPGDGMVLQSAAGAVRLQLGRRVVSTTPVAGTTADCRLLIHAAPAGMTITTGGNRTINLAGEPVPKVFAFHTDLDARQAAGISVTARTASPFATSPSGIKLLLIGVQLLAALVALGLLTRTGTTPGWRLIKAGQLPRWRFPPGWRLPTGWRLQRWWRTALVDAGVLGVLAGWAIIGPLTDDDGFATTIARNAVLTGNAGNYYRWWNAAEAPFAMTEQLLGPLTDISLAPLWLRLPSTVLGMATWFVLSRGVLGAALPTMAATVRIRVLAAVCLLAAWLPFNLGVRPEPYVAFGVTTVLALLWRARGLTALGWAALIAGLTIPTSPSALLVAAPIVMFAPRIIAILRDSARGRAEVLARVALLGCLGAVGVTVIFADQTWTGLVTATHWHNYFGPSLPWYHEPDRYRFLLGSDQDGSATKRIPVLLTLALLPVVGVLLVRRTKPGSVDSSATRLAGVVATALALLWLAPSKWTHHFGALAGLFAAFLVVAVVLLVRRAQTPVPDPVAGWLGMAGAALVAAAAGLAFTGPNAWWQPAVYDVPWAAGPVRPLGLALDSPLLWIGALVVGYAALAARRGRAGVATALVAAPALVTVAAAGTAVAVLLGSLAAAPVRRPIGSLALVNLHRLTGGPSCGLADAIEVLPDGPILSRVPAPGLAASDFAVPHFAGSGFAGRLAGFTALGGFDPAFPPPNPPGTGQSTELWGSLRGGPRNTGTLTSPWFSLPALDPSSGLAVSVSGRTDRGNKLILEFGKAGYPGVTTLGDRTPYDRVRPDQDHLNGPLDYRPWRSIGLDASQIPAGANRVRIRAVDATTDPDGWLAVTGPRLRSVVALNKFLAGRGPVLVSWPQAFLFPCVHNIVTVADGLAGAPRVVIEAPRRLGRLSAVTTAQDQGGDFAAIRSFGQLYEVPTRVAGHPEVDWGALQLSADPTARDTYQRTTRTSPAPRAAPERGKRRATG